MRRPLFRPVWHAFAVLALALVAIDMPTYPDSPEKNPPTTNATGTNQVSIPKAAMIDKITNMAIKNMISTLY